MAGGILLILRLLMAVSLYVFIALAMRHLWRNLEFQQEIISAQRIQLIELKFVNESGQQVYQFRKPTILIGRDPDCECALSSETVSVHHARLSYRNSQWWIEDLNSTNGSYLNDDIIETPTVVVDGDLLRCGDILINVNIN